MEKYFIFIDKTHNRIYYKRYVCSVLERCARIEMKEFVLRAACTGFSITLEENPAEFLQVIIAEVIK